MMALLNCLLLVLVSVVAAAAAAADPDTRRTAFALSGAADGLLHAQKHENFAVGAVPWASGTDSVTKAIPACSWCKKQFLVRRSGPGAVWGCSARGRTLRSTLTN